MNQEEKVGRRVLVSTASQLIAKLFHLVFNVVSTLAIVHYLTPKAYGAYVLVVTVTTLVGLVADFGLPQLAVREISSARAGEREVIGTVIGVRLGLAVAALGITQLVLLAMGQPRAVHLAAGVASFIFLGDAVLAAVLAVFQVRLVQQYEALIRVVMEGFETAFVLVLIARHASLAWLFVPSVVGSAFGALLAVTVARRRFALTVRFDASLVRRMMIDAIPIGPALLIGVIYLKLDSLTLGVMKTPRDLGLYGTAYQPIEYTFLAMAVIINVIFPLLSRAVGEQDHARFTQLYQRGTEVLVIVTLVVPVLLTFIATPMVKLVFGRDYAEAAAPLRVLAVALVLMTVNAWQSLVLLAGGLQAVTLRYNIIALVVAVVLCIGLVAAFGLIGAAVASLGTAIYVLYASTMAVRTRLDAHLDLHRIARILLAALAALAVAGVLRSLDAPWPVVGALALLSYPAGLLLVGAHRGFSSEPETRLTGVPA